MWSSIVSGVEAVMVPGRRLAVCAGIFIVSLYCAVSLGSAQPSDGSSPKASASTQPGPSQEATLIAQLRAAQQAKDWARAENLLLQLISIDASSWEYQKELAEAQSRQAKYADALAACGKAILQVDSDRVLLADRKAALAQLYTGRGNIYLKLKKNNLAIADYEKSASFSSNPSLAYFNICATLYNTGNMQDALKACDKAISADPARADAYFIKGSVLFAEGSFRGNKFLAPQGTADALNKYLELAPSGSHSPDVKEMLKMLDSPAK